MKKYRSLIVILVLVALAGISFYLSLSTSKTSTVDVEARNFSYKDTAAITKIFMADKDNHSATIVRTKEGWIVNEKYHCRTDAILNLLEVIKHVEVKMPVPKTAKDNVIKFMSFSAVKVEIYKDDEKVRQYYVGHETNESDGSYMLLTDLESEKNYKDPFICFIPGFQGFLQPRYIVNENDWRDRVVVNYIPPQIQQIKVEHIGNSPDSSFTIDLIDANSFKLKNLSGKEIIYDEAKLKQYLIYFQNLSYEVLITGKNKNLQDSLSQVKPFTVISILTKDSKTEEYKFYRKQARTDLEPEHGVVYDYDPDRMYLRFQGDKEWALSQYFVFGKLFINTNYFMPSSTVKK